MQCGKPSWQIRYSVSPQMVVWAETLNAGKEKSISTVPIPVRTQVDSPKMAVVKCNQSATG